LRKEPIYVHYNEDIRCKWYIDILPYCVRVHSIIMAITSTYYGQHQQQML